MAGWLWDFCSCLGHFTISNQSFNGGERDRFDSRKNYGVQFPTFNKTDAFDLRGTTGRRHKITGREPLWAAVRMGYGCHLHGRPTASDIYECKHIAYLSSTVLRWHETGRRHFYDVCYVIKQIKRGSVEVRPKTL